MMTSRERVQAAFAHSEPDYAPADYFSTPEIQAALVQLYNRLKYRSGSRQVMAAPYPENLSFIIGHDVGLSQPQEIKLLAMPVERDRQMYLFQHLIRTQ